ncbi:hypothetical protein [Paucihalobacter sp.]|uniref:hypothetical protein n=1 Tax=Paucihalobacter sp. TaxID=2850405 RepID=UPI002FE32339
MAKTRSLLNIEGTLGEMTFYKDGDGYKIRTKGGVSKNRIETDPAFVRTRENMGEFAQSATIGKQLRLAAIDLMADAKDKRVTSRLTRVMSKVRNQDTTSVRGQRKVYIGLSTPEGRAALKGFEFYGRSTLSSVLLADYNLDTVTGEVSIIDFIPARRLNFPQGATNVSLSCGFLNLDFETGDKALELSNVVNLPINLTATTVTLTPPAAPAGTGNQLYFLKVAFFQEMNAVQYPLNNGAFNALQLIEVL